jgi:hypothetical protein
VSHAPAAQCKAPFREALKVLGQPVIDTRHDGCFVYVQCSGRDEEGGQVNRVRCFGTCQSVALNRRFVT